ncbi:hypothetical protein G6F65_023168 [Rhizopus arrhizus]|nr:hypothetical protein G6F65_023168 [Rhizopus arrhizus]
MPRRGNARGSAFSSIQEPPGRTGATTVSQVTHKTIRANSETEASRRKRGLSSGFMLLLSPDESPRRACRRYAGGHRALDFALFMGCEGRPRLPVHGAARQR